MIDTHILFVIVLAFAVLNFLILSIGMLEIRVILRNRVGGVGVLVVDLVVQFLLWMFALGGVALIKETWHLRTMGEAGRWFFLLTFTAIPCLANLRYYRWRWRVGEKEIEGNK